MIDLQQRNQRQCLVLTPNHSANWQANKRIFLIVAGISLGIASGFAAIGAWIILPFAGLEVMALGGALYWSNWHANYRQVIWIEGDGLTIEKGYYRPAESWRWLRRNTAIHVTEGEKLAISLANGGTRISLGEFLGEEDLRSLLRELRKLGLPTQGFGKEQVLDA